MSTDTTQIEVTRERVDAYEKALGCDRPSAGALIAGAYGLCYHHDEVRDALGCPVAVAATRVEAAHVAEARAALDRVRALVAQRKTHPGLIIHGWEIIAAIDGTDTTE